MNLVVSQKMTIRNEKVERKKCKEMKKNESTIAKIEARVLIYTNYQCD